MGFVFGPCFAEQYLVSFLVSHLDGEEGAGRFTLLAFSCQVTVSVLCLFLVLPWIDLQCVIVIFRAYSLTFWSIKFQVSFLIKYKPKVS